MELKTYFAQDRNGNLIPSANVSIYLTGTTTLASGLTTVSNEPLANPFTADADGKIQFHAPDGIYDMQVALGSTTGVKVTFQCVDVEQQLSDANSAADRAEAAADSVEAVAATMIVGLSFSAGGTLRSTRDYIYDATGKRWCFWAGTYPAGGLVVAPGSTPEGTGGFSDTAWKDLTDKQLRNDLASTDNAKGDALITTKQLLASAISRTLHDKISDFVSVKDFGAVGDGANDDSDAINAAFLAAQKVYFPVGTYRHTKQIVMHSDNVIDLRGAKITPSDTLLTAAWVANAADDLTVLGGVFSGTGLDNTTGNGQLMTLTNCNRALVSGTHFTKSPNDGLRFIGCSHSEAVDVHSYNNLSVGIQDREGNYNLISRCYCHHNGDTGTVQNTGGRGILLWRTKGSLTADCYTFNNTEYGFRNYSQTGDSTGSYQNIISNLRSGDNLKIDIYVYNEEGSLAEITFNNSSVRRTTQPQGTCVALQGKNVSFNGGVIKKEGDRLTVPAISLYQTTKAAVRNVTVENAGQLISFSSAVDSVISGLVAECATVSNGGTNTLYLNNSFKHGGTGTTDIAIDAGNTDTPVLKGNTFDGFYRNVSWNAQRMVLIDNNSLNTTDVSLRMFGDGIPNYWASGNNWDKAGNPAVIGDFIRQGSITSKPTVYVTAAPATLTWPVGAIAINSAPAVGSPKAWRCTVAGTPGTWVSEGNL